MGDGAGAVGLLSAGMLGLGGDVVALVDDNEYSTIVLRGLFSKTIRRTALGISQMFSGGMEGMRGEDINGLPESMKGYTEPELGDLQSRLPTLERGLGSAGLAVVDGVCNPLLFLLRLAGVEDPAKAIVDSQVQARDRWVGTTK
jgi:hypothetical protein